jgi:hypothetical protein
MSEEEYHAAIAAFIRSNGVTRCPTACALPTQGAIAAADQAALQHYAAMRNQSRSQKIAACNRSFWAAKVLGEAG